MLPFLSRVRSRVRSLIIRPRCLFHILIDVTRFPSKNPASRRTNSSNNYIRVTGKGDRAFFFFFRRTRNFEALDYSRVIRKDRWNFFFFI